MRRLIQICNNRLDVLAEAIGSKMNTFAPIFSITLTENTSTLDLSDTAASYYQIPKDESVKKQADYLINCITRCEEGKQNDMHIMINQFFDGVFTNITTIKFFSREGYLPENAESKHEQKMIFS